MKKGKKIEMPAISPDFLCALERPPALKKKGCHKDNQKHRIVKKYYKKDSKKRRKKEIWT